MTEVERNLLIVIAGVLIGVLKLVQKLPFVPLDTKRVIENHVTELEKRVDDCHAERT